jgi:hypothetical protein
MKKVIIALLMSLMCFGAFAQTDEQTMEVIPTISASGNQEGLALDSELVIAKRFTLSNKWFLYGQLGAMYNVYKFKFGEEWQLGFEPMVGVGTNRIRLSGFLNGLAVKNFETGKMPFLEGGARLSLTPWKNVWVSVFGTWPISDPVFVMPLEDTFFEDDLGVFLVGSEKWARQVNSYGFDVDFGFGKKFIASLDGFKIEGENYQLGAGLQYQLFKSKPWIIGGNVFYTKFENENWYYIHNLFPGMLGNDPKGYTFKLGISNYGGLGVLDFSQKLGRIAEPMYFSPVIWEVKKGEPKRINDPFKVDCCNIGDPKCLDFVGSICISGGTPPYKIFVDWGDGTSIQYTVNVPGNFPISHHYLNAVEPIIMVSGMDKNGKTSKPCGNKIIAKDCGDNDPKCDKVQMSFEADRNTVKLGETVNFSWNVDGATRVTFENAEVEANVGKYPIVFNSLGSFPYTLRAYTLVDGVEVFCKEQTITINTVNCDIPIIAYLTVTPSKVVGSGDVTVAWSVQKADKVLLAGVIVDAVGSKLFHVTGPMSWLLEAINACTSIDKTVSVEWEEIPCPTAISSAPQGFELPNSSPETETAWVNANVMPGPWVFLKKDDGFSGNCASASTDASVVLVKAGTKYIYYLNVVAGQQLCSYDGKGISHISYFTCKK